MKLDYKLADLAASQAGYLGHNQVASMGLSDDAIHWRLKKGVFTPAAKGIYRVSGISGDHHGLLRAATAILPDATASHESAAEIWQMPFVPRQRVVVTVHASTTHNFPGVVIHRSIDLFDHHRTLVNGMKVTTAARTLTDLAAVLRPKHLAKVGDEALAGGFVDFGDVKTTFLETARRGRTGSGPMRVFINERDGSKPIKATTLERVGMGVFERGGLRGRSFNIRLLGTLVSGSISPGRGVVLGVRPMAGAGTPGPRTSRRIAHETILPSSTTGGSFALRGKTFSGGHT
jgi:hypothetical protein